MSTNDIPVIDTHVHCWADSLAPRVIEKFIGDWGATAYFDGTVDGLLQSMDANGVERSVILPVATKPTQVVTINDWLATYLGNDRITPFAAIHPDFVDPATEIARVAGLGFKGMKLHPLNQVFQPWEERMFPIYDAVIEQDLVLTFHAGAGMDFDAIRGSKEDFDRFFELYDYDKVVIAHLGGYRDWQSNPEKVAGRPGYLDCAYTLGRVPDDLWLDIVRSHGVDRVLFATDGPWVSLKHDLEYIRTIGLSDDELRMILHDNAATLLDL